MITMKDYSLKIGDFSLCNVNLQIKDNEIFALLGETGAGKTVLLEALAGFYDSGCGDIRYGDIPVKDIPIKDRRIGFVYQDFSLFPHMTVRDNIEFGLKMHRIPLRNRRKISYDVMNKLKIEHLKSRYPETLSGGEKQRTALARAIVLKPQVLFMDEPFSALDPATREQMYGIIKEIHGTYNCTVIFVTHNFNEAAVLADRVGVMIGGRLREVCNSCELFRDHDDYEVMKFLGKEEALS